MGLLERFFELKIRGQQVAGIATRPIPLIVGPSGSGKTHVVREFARQSVLPVFDCNFGTWIVTGNRIETNTLKQIAEFIQNHGRGIIFIDEVDKLAGNTDWARCISFRRWRGNQDLAAKTLNHYLITIRTLLNWLEKQGKLHGSPLKTVETTRKVGGSERKRRAFTDEEISILLKATPNDSYRLVIRTAVLTGLRYAEIAALLWGDLRLDNARPHVMLRDEMVKNRNGKPHSLHPDLAVALAEFRPTDAVADDAVFPSMPDMDDHRALLAKAGVLYVSGGRYADFHSFRVNFRHEPAPGRGAATVRQWT